jgi:thiamine transport system substrate-binding protein
MRANRVLVMADWYDAYFQAFSGARSRGDRPIIPSSAAGPVSEMQFMEPRPAAPPIGVLLDGCQRDVTFAGVLVGSERPELARALIDFLLSPEVQADLPTWLLRAPVLASAPLPAEWLAWAAAPRSPSLLDPTITQAQLDAWVDEWAAIVTP